MTRGYGRSLTTGTTLITIAILITANRFLITEQGVHNCHITRLQSKQLLLINVKKNECPGKLQIKVW